MTSIDSNLKALSNTADNLQTQVTNNLNSANGAYTTLRNEYKAWVPIGTVCLWVYAGAIPTGWAVCDGRTVTRTDGAGPLTTPNLMGRFILADPTPGSVGGNYTASANTSSVGNHSHGGVTADTALSIAQMPAHTHGGGFANLVGISQGGFSQGVNARTQTDSTGGGVAHNHGVFADGGHNHTVTLTVVPNYYTAIYIMRY
jgi:hypothetical protein